MADAHTDVVTAVPPLDTGKRLVLALSRVWAWVFLICLVLFFTISVSATSDGLFVSPAVELCKRLACAGTA